MVVKNLRMFFSKLRIEYCRIAPDEYKRFAFFLRGNNFLVVNQKNQYNYII